MAVLGELSPFPVGGCSTVSGQSGVALSSPWVVVQGGLGNSDGWL